VFGERAQAVAMRRHQHALAADDSGGDMVFPKRQHTLQRYFQIFAVRHHIGGQMGIAAVVMGGKFVVFV
jgi:hypothetical protein